MLKLQLVEDVKIVRDTLTNHIDWGSLGLTVTGIAEDGRQALEQMAADPPPDLLVTDIGMAMMDGIELIRLAKARYPELKCIILSGLSEFKYAQEAIKLGVVDYVLKPIDIDELSSVIRRAVASIREERSHRHELLNAKQIVMEKLPNLARLPNQSAQESLRLSGNKKNMKLVEQMMAFIQANLANPALSLLHVAHHISLSEKYVNSLFKEVAGTTINSYIITLKMEWAAALLKDPNVKVYEVCDRIGYSDKDYFRDSFKKHHGCTPSEYRTRHL